MRRTADFNKANTVFNNMIAQKMDAAMDQERIATANKIFNDIEPEELEAEAEADEEPRETAETEETSESEETDEAEVEGHPV